MFVVAATGDGILLGLQLEDDPLKQISGKEADYLVESVILLAGS